VRVDEHDLRHRVDERDRLAHVRESQQVARLAGRVAARLAGVHWVKADVREHADERRGRDEGVARAVRCASEGRGRGVNQALGAEGAAVDEAGLCEVEQGVLL